MTISSYILGGIVLVYTIIYAVKNSMILMHYKKCVEAGDFKIVEGRIVEKVDELNKAIQHQMVNMCFPRFDFEIEGKHKSCQSSVRYRDASIGQTAEIRYCERTGEAWVTQDIPVMKRNLIIRTVLMAAILTLLVLTDVLL